VIAYALKAWGWRYLFAQDRRPRVLTLAAAGGAASVGGVALPGRFDEVIRIAVVRRCRGCKASLGAVGLSIVLVGLLDSAALTPLASVAAALSAPSTMFRVGLALVAALVASGVHVEQALAFAVAAQALVVVAGALIVVAMGTDHVGARLRVALAR